MTDSRRPSDWGTLFKIARSLICQANAEQTIIDDWTFGGGTAMMLHINHRESHDVDIFLTDRQLLPFLDPKIHDFQFDIIPNDYQSDGAGFVKLAFAGIGEIDFIVGATMTADPAISFEIDGEPCRLETIPEIIAKKIYYRGGHIKPRDIFDIAAASEKHAEDIIRALSDYPEQVERALKETAKRNPDFVAAAISELAIKQPYRRLTKTALTQTQDILKSALAYRG